MRLLVAGIGNIFFGDDGFGSQVAQVLAEAPIEDVKIEDFGIRGLHLAFELISGYERAFLIDAVPRGGVPGTLYVIEPDVAELPQSMPDAHRMDLQNVFAFVRTIGGEPPPVTVVGCEPSTSGEEIGLSDAVSAAVTPAAELVRRLVGKALNERGSPQRRSTQWTGV
ncbi:MAG: hydrogenase maturation protease [Candidatus Cybelea sp.]|jgi:hydrogenase maturation protease